MGNEVFASYFDYYINKVNHLSGDEALDSGKDQMLNYLSELDHSKLDHAYEEGKWTVAQVVLHIMDVERVMAFRALSIARGEKNALPGFDHEMFALEAPVKNYNKTSLIEEYTALRQSTKLMFKHLTSEQLARSGTFGGNSLNVQGIWHMISGHEQHHLSVLLDKY